MKRRLTINCTLKKKMRRIDCSAKQFPFITHILIVETTIVSRILRSIVNFCKNVLSSKFIFFRDPMTLSSMYEEHAREEENNNLLLDNDEE